MHNNFYETQSEILRDEYKKTNEIINNLTSWLDKNNCWINYLSLHSVQKIKEVIDRLTEQECRRRALEIQYDVLKETHIRQMNEYKVGGIDFQHTSWKSYESFTFDQQSFEAFGGISPEVEVIDLGARLKNKLV